MHIEGDDDGVGYGVLGKGTFSLTLPHVTSGVVGFTYASGVIAGGQPPPATVPEPPLTVGVYGV